MKKMTSIIVLLLLCFSCGEKSSSKKNGKSDSADLKKDEKTLIKSSADYSSLLTEYECDMSIAEVAEILEIPESDLSIPETTIPGKCLFSLESFGKNVFNGGSRLLWGPSPSSKAQNKKEIKSYLERKKEGLKIMGMDIQLAETGDCYLAYQPAHGTIIIYNEHYDQAFLINYGRRNANTDRTKDQHEELRLKMKDLANYLLKKHRK